MVSCQRIVCCIDFSEFSGRALQYAAALARWYDARVTAVHATANVPAVDVFPIAARGMPPEQLAAVDRNVVAESLRTFVSAHVPGTQIVDAVVIEADSVARRPGRD